MNKLRLVDLFSGIGGFSLALESTGGFETIAFCEQDGFCQQVLKKHWPTVTIFEDVKELPYAEIGKTDIITAGFPCQPWSQAGPARGTADERDLWNETAAAISQLEPEWFIGENVRGFVNPEMGLARSLDDLENLGYQTQAFVIPAASFRPHRRDRVWIIAHFEGSPPTLADAGCLSSRTGQEIHRPPAQRRQGAVHAGDRDQDVADSIGIDAQGERTDAPAGRRQDQKRPSGLCGGAIPAIENRRTGPRSAECGLGGMADGLSGWLDEPDIPRLAVRQPDRRKRLKALGNSIVPQIAVKLGEAILEARQ